MNDYRLKVTLSILSGIIFSLLFIILALVLPYGDDGENFARQQPSNKLEEISHGISCFEIR